MIEDNEFLQHFNDMFERCQLTMPELMDHMGNFFGYYAVHSADPIEEMNHLVERLVYWANKYSVEAGKGPLVVPDEEEGSDL